jgi:hypothetical protein
MSKPRVTTARKRATKQPLVDESIPGTGFLGCCLNCSQIVGKPHLERCEFVTGEDDPRRHGGILGASLEQVRRQK